MVHHVAQQKIHVTLEKEIVIRIIIVKVILFVEMITVAPLKMDGIKGLIAARNLLQPQLLHHQHQLQRTVAKIHHIMESRVGEMELPVVAMENCLSHVFPQRALIIVVFMNSPQDNVKIRNHVVGVMEVKPLLHSVVQMELFVAKAKMN